MELPDIVSVRKFREFNTEQKEELYETLLQLIEAIEEIPKKSLRRTLDVTLAVLQYKGEQVAILQTQLEDKESSEDDSQSERLLMENEKLKVMLSRLQDENATLKLKAEELTEDIFLLQKRMQEAAQTAAGADDGDKDSSDPLSELDKQEDLLRNINAKNKHIKRLLREIEGLQNQNIAQSKTIIECERELHQSKTKLVQLSADITIVDSERKTLKEKVNNLNLEITRLESNITYLEEQREKGEREMKGLIEKLEIKAQSWKNMLYTKDKELKKLRARLEEAGEPTSNTESVKETESERQINVAAEAEEKTRLLHALEIRDKHIETLEAKIKQLAQEMMSSTKLMNQLSAEKEEARDPNKSRVCCKTIEQSLQAATERCRELSQMLERSEEDNALKSKQAMQAISALDAYQRGEDGLMKALRKCTALEQKLSSRDKQIRALIMELNSMHEIAHENGILRKRLNIPDDVVISAKNLIAKERNKEKMIERLTLKLRASEEMRLQLKLEKSDLRKELLELQKQLQKPTHQFPAEEVRAIATLDSLRVPSEIGEVTESGDFSNGGANNATANFCINCKLSLDIPDESNQVMAAAQLKYQDVLDENDTLRAGMLEILEKLREYDASSDHINIDTEILYRLLEALRTSSVPNTPKRLQNEIETLKAREEALRALIEQQPAQPLDELNADVDADATDEISSVQSMREDGEVRDGFVEDLSLDLHKQLDSSTRPTTPNKNITQTELPIIISDKTCAEIRQLELQVAELKVYRSGFEDLQKQMKANDVELSQDYASVRAELASTQLALNREKCAFAFMREDYDNTLNELKQAELRHIDQVTELRKELSLLNDKLINRELEYEHLLNAGNFSKADYLQVQAANADLRAQLAHITEQVLAGKLDAELQIPDICSNYGIINENQQLDYLTIEEYQQLQNSTATALKERDESLRKSAQLESLLQIAQNQIQSQQKLLNEITDNHVNLRHLVADLQSNSEDKLSLAKMQRELESAKQDLSNLRLQSDKLQQKCTTIKSDLKVKDQKLIQHTKDFQMERKTKDIKIKFLQKSLNILREKYAKFTPLIFLTNFVFAYTKFTKKALCHSEDDKSEQYLETVKDSIIAKLGKENAFIDTDPQNLIKFIKSETHCKLLETNLQNLQKKYDTLQGELLEQRMHAAQETEHWQTIVALFGGENAERVDSSKLKADAGIKEMKSTEQTHTQQDVATNTEAPLPVERKLSANSSTLALRRKSAVEMLDKNLSPIGSPVRRIRKADANTQTSEQLEEIVGRKMADLPSREKDNLSSLTATERITLAEPRKQTNDVIVQTPREVKESRSAQTDASASGETSHRLNESTFTDLKEQIAEMQQKLNARESALTESKQNLQNANKRIEELQHQLNGSELSEKHARASDTKSTAPSDESSKSDIIEKTILSFHTLLSEKDKTISKYQELLQTEREQIQVTTTKLDNEIGDLKSTITNLNFNIKTKDMEILELKGKLEVACVRRNSAEKLDLATEGMGNGGGGAGDNSLNELTDEKIEEMFDEEVESVTEEPTEARNSHSQRTEAVITAKGKKEENEKQDTETLKEMPTLLAQIKELKEKTSYLSKSLAVKEEELALLKEKLNLYEERERSLECAVNPETEQMRLMLEEKDKHISDLTETLNSFHDDQQRYLKDSSSYSADQIAKLHADLTRSEATKKIYYTQIEALRRQITSLTQREKQARELNQSLRNQLIKRPVVSIKTELNARVKTENLQKRIHTLELDLEDAHAQIQRQQVMLDAKRAKSASEVGLWEKQKRWQQNAEKYKAKFEEAEGALQKTRTLLQSARTMVSRLEKEKQALEAKCGRGGGQTMQTMKCCRTPSCPNLQHATGGSGGSSSVGKYTPSESPDTFTGASSECSSPAHSLPAHDHHQHNNKLLQGHCFGGGTATCGCASGGAAAKQTQTNAPNAELIEALKARLELQQRKILAMELEGKGSNALTTEMEKLQEKLSEVEAQNIRLEAKNLQLQLDNDLLRQGDATERLQKRIKYLEDYIIALKEEMAQAEARRELCKCSGIKLNTQLGQSAEQTILSLRGIVEKLRAENKFLKEGRRPCESRLGADKTNAEVSRLQKLYAEALEKNSALQVELETAKAKCRNCGKSDTSMLDELNFIKEQHSKKIQLLQKAKVLLTRAAAKEKVLKEQLLLWKRKCFELQNVPVIDEISE